MFAVWEYKEELKTYIIDIVIICVRGWELTNMLRDYGQHFTKKLNTSRVCKNRK